jgi:hypothetical protein
VGRAAITIRAHASASDPAWWWISPMPSRRHTAGRFAGESAHFRRANCTVHTNGCGGASSPAAAQHASSTRRSNGALCAARNSAPSSTGATFRHTSANSGASFTMCHEMPWTWVNSTRPPGGRISSASRWTTFPPSTRASPTAHALSGPVSAVSKSSATNGPPSGGSGAGGRREGMMGPSVAVVDDQFILTEAGGATRAPAGARRRSSGRTGCADRSRCRYHVPRAGPHAQAPNAHE